MKPTHLTDTNKVFDAGTAISLAVAAVVFGCASAALLRGPEVFLHGIQLQIYLQSRSVLRSAVFALYVALSFITGALLVAGALLRSFDRPFLPCYGYACVGLFMSGMLAEGLWSGVGLEEVIVDCWRNCGFPH